MLFILSVLCAVSANLDTLAVSAAFGVKKVKISFPAAIAISVISTFGTWISMSLGVLLTDRINSAIMNWTGAIVLMGMGVWFIINGIREAGGHDSTPAMLSHPETADSDHSGSIDLKESVALASAMTVNNLAVGAAAGVAGLDVRITIAFTFLATLLCMKLGVEIGGKFLARWLGKYASLISGCLIFLIGMASAVFLNR
ncbi:MAG: manganese efflux pump [Clostridiales bacterium]|nr:manganese efflux pump [Clostridiales bacterium]